MKFRKKPVVIDAVQVSKHMGLEPDWFATAVTKRQIDTYGMGKFGEGPVYVEIHTLEGHMRGDEGDYIIRGVLGEFYPCKSDIFELTYEPAKD